jgi:serine/threonine-protein kinase
MEYIEGKNIGQIIAENGPLPPSIAARLCRQVALGLEHAQRKGLIHRDVNPYNILVTRDGTAKLTDLGLAIDLAEQDRVTRDGATVGTFDYVSPEQARHSHGVDTRSDIYSLGCSLYHMLAGRVPFPSASLPEKLYGHQMLEADSLTALDPGIPAGLAAVVARTMRKSPDDRYATPLELAQALEPFSDPAGDEVPTSNGALVSRAAPVRTQVGAPVLEADSYPILAPVLATPMPAPGATPIPVSEPSAAVVSTVPTDVLNGAGANPSTPVPTTPKPLPKRLAQAKVDLAVTLAPEPSLSESLTATKIKPKAAAKPRPWTFSAARLPGWTVPAAAVGAVLIMGGILLVWHSLSGETSDLGTRPIPPKVRDGDPSRPAPDPASRTPAEAIATNSQAIRLREPQGREFRVVAGDGSLSNEPDLKSAMGKAIGSKGYVEFRNRNPMQFGAEATITISGGLVDLRARPGLKPVIEVEVRSGKPFLTALGETPLRIEGITFVARYTDPPSAGAEPTPVIQAVSNVALDRCSFSVEGDTTNVCALQFQGIELNASGCWFENFDVAVLIDAFRGSTSTLKNSMFLRTRKDLPGGWAVRMTRMPSGDRKSGRRLDLSRCTAKGEGFLALRGFSAQDPVTVDLKGCAVLAEALVSWQTAGAENEPVPPSRSISWSGQDNQFDLGGKSWLWAGPPGGAPVPLADGPANLESWTRRVGTETETVPPPIRFATDPSGMPEHPGPADFVITGLGTKQTGADARLVGPGARPASRQ